MKTFTDAAGRTWTIALNLGTAMAVKDAHQIDLLKPEEGNPPLITRLGTDEFLLAKVICAFLMDQFEAHKVTEADVRKSFDGRTLLAAQTAFYEELAGFFQSRGRTDRARAVLKQKTLIEKATVAATVKIDGFDEDAMVAEAMAEAEAEAASTPGAKSGGSPAPSA